MWRCTNKLGAIIVSTSFTRTVCRCCCAVAIEGASYLQSPAVTAAHASELKAAGGIITAKDLAEAVPQERELLKMQVCTSLRFLLSSIRIPPLPQTPLCNQHKVHPRLEMGRGGVGCRWLVWVVASLVVQ